MKVQQFPTSVLNANHPALIRVFSKVNISLQKNPSVETVPQIASRWLKKSREKIHRPWFWQFPSSTDF